MNKRLVLSELRNQLLLASASIFPLWKRGTVATIVDEMFYNIESAVDQGTSIVETLFYIGIQLDLRLTLSRTLLGGDEVDRMRELLQRLIHDTVAKVKSQRSAVLFAAHPEMRNFFPSALNPTVKFDIKETPSQKSADRIALWMNEFRESMAEFMDELEDLVEEDVEEKAIKRATNSNGTPIYRTVVEAMDLPSLKKALESIIAGIDRDIAEGKK